MNIPKNTQNKDDVTAEIIDKISKVQKSVLQEFLITDNAILKVLEGSKY